MRILLFTGKGGVGKTTTAAATALALRRRRAAHDRAVDRSGALAGRRVRRRRSAPLAAPITDSLWGQQLDAQERMEEAWGEIQQLARARCFDWAGVDAIEAEELAVLPGLDEVFALADIKAYADVRRVGRDRRRLRARPPRRSASSPCPTSSPGTWSGSSRSAAG